MNTARRELNEQRFIRNYRELTSCAEAHARAVYIHQGLPTSPAAAAQEPEPEARPRAADDPFGITPAAP